MKYMNSFRLHTSLIAMAFCCVLSCQSDYKGSSEVVSKADRAHLSLEMVKVGEAQVNLGNTYNYDNFTGLTNQTSGDSSRVIHLSNGQIFDFDPINEKLNYYYEIPTKGPNKINPQSDFDGVVAVGNGNYIYSANILSKMFLISPDGVDVLVNMKKREDIFLVNSTQNRPESLPNNQFMFGISPDPTDNLSEKNAFLKVNATDNSFEYRIEYPVEYSNYFYSTTPYLYWASVKYSVKKREYIVSFPVSDYLYIYDDNFRLKKKVVVATSQFNEVEAFSPPVKLGEYPEPEKEDKYFRELSYYYSLYLDDYNEYIYRQVKKRNPNSRLGYDYYMMVIDFDYNVVGEWKIPEYLRPFNVFCNKNGLNIYDEGALGVTEAGIATFSIYLPE